MDMSDFCVCVCVPIYKSNTVCERTYMPYVDRDFVKLASIRRHKGTYDECRYALELYFGTIPSICGNVQSQSSVSAFVAVASDTVKVKICVYNVKKKQN